MGNGPRQAAELRRQAFHPLGVSTGWSLNGLLPAVTLELDPSIQSPEAKTRRPAKSAGVIVGHASDCNLPVPDRLASVSRMARSHASCKLNWASLSIVSLSSAG